MPLSSSSSSSSLTCSSARWACGSNGSGCLGLAHTEDVWQLTLSSSVQESSDESPTEPAEAAAGPSPARKLSSSVRFSSISCGGCHTLAIDAAGRVWSWGDNTRGQLGLGGAPSGESLPSASSAAAFAATDVVSWPRLMPFFAAGRWCCTHVSAGWTHSACVATLLDVADLQHAATSSNRAARGSNVLTWGDNRYLQLGIGSAASSSEMPVSGQPAKPAALNQSDIPLLVPALEGRNAEQVHCAWKHTLIRTTDGRVFACGDNAHGQLGLGDYLSRTEPTLITLADDAPASSAAAASPLLCAEVAVGWKHSLLMTLDRKRLYGMGSNSFGQLGSLNDDSAAEAASTHSADNRAGRAGRVPRSSSLKVCRPRLVTLPASFDLSHSHLLQVAAGWSHSLLLTSSNQLFAWGRADMGQIATPPAASSQAVTHGASATSSLSKSVPLPVEIRLPPRSSLSCDACRTAASEPAPIRHIACGSEHSIVVTDSDVWLCGWNEHGNLGLGHNEPLSDPYVFVAAAALHVCPARGLEHCAQSASQHFGGSAPSEDDEALRAAASEADVRCIRAVATGGAAVILLH